MLYAWIDDNKRAPVAKGERTTCRDCGGLLTSVMPVENTPHWRHKAGDCDPWSEPEGPWHVGWKELFDMSCREIALRDPATGELHRADVLVGEGTPRATVLELQHSPISEDERSAREAFYRRGHRMFWLVHIHSENSFLGTYFSMSLDFNSRVINLDGKEFAIMRWMGPNKQFIEKWKRATAHVFFSAGPYHNCPRYLSNTEFTQLARSGWIGTGAQSAALLRAVLEANQRGGRQAMLAVIEPPKEPSGAARRWRRV